MRGYRDFIRYSIAGGLFCLFSVLATRTSYAADVGQQNADAFENSGEIRIVAIIPQKSDVSFWSDVEAGMRLEAAEQSAQLTILYKEADQKSLELGLTQALKTAYYLAPDAMIVTYAYADGATDDVIRRAREEGIKVVFIDNEGESGLSDAYAGIDNYNAGRQLGEAALLGIHTSVENSAGESAENETAALLAVFDTSAGRKNISERIQGMTGVMEKAGVTLLTVVMTGENQLEQSQELRTALLNHPETAVVLTADERSTTAVGRVLSRMQESVEIGLYGFDLTDETQVLLDEGVIRALVAQNPEAIGKDGVRKAVMLLSEMPDNPENVQTGANEQPEDNPWTWNEEPESLLYGLIYGGSSEER